MNFLRSIGIGAAMAGVCFVVASMNPITFFEMLALANLGMVSALAAQQPRD